MWNLDTRGGCGGGARAGYGGASSPSRYSEEAAMYSDRLSVMSSIISWLCFSTKAAVAALETEFYVGIKYHLISEHFSDYYVLKSDRCKITVTINVMYLMDDFKGFY